MSKNKNLHDARKAKQDEFYTQLEDVEKEMNEYLDYNPDVFRDKTILLPCDDPEWSNFTRFFLSRFHEYGIKKLISTSYATQSSEEEQSYGRGKILIIDGTVVNNNGGDVEELKWEYLQGDGDFSSDEVTELRDEADMVITNPPFSLFREFMAWLVEGDVEFSIIGSMNAITYKEIFPLIKENKVWLGRGKNTGGNSMWFEVPKIYPENKHEKFTDKGSRIIPVTSKWFTNIQHGRRHDPLQLMTMDDNLRFNNRIIKNDNSYKPYDNYDAIEVPVTAGIPSDYDGVMGVPISFLDKYNPDQFEILGSFNAGAHGEEVGSTYTPTIIGGEEKLWNGPVVDKQPLYKRILIQHKKNNDQE